MEVGCDLEVDVNGQETFMVNKEILSSFSVRFNRLFGSLTSCSSHLKVLFHDFPGGAKGFELLVRFCYKGTTEITPSNLVLLNQVTQFMEIGSNSSPGTNMRYQIEKSIDGINSWNWSELLVAVRQCQDLLPEINPPLLLDRILDCFVARIALPLPSVASPFYCSSDNSTCQTSSDTSTCCSTRFSCSPTTWWFEDLLFLNAYFFDKVLRKMVSQKLYHATIFKFLVFYLRWKFLRVSPSQKSKITDLAIKILPLLDRDCLSCKGLFDVLRVLSSLKRIRRHHKLKLEKLIGMRLDQATPDYLLIPSPRGRQYKYDVCLVLRLVKAFLMEGWMNPIQLKKVANLIDSYLIEVAPDMFLKPSKFLEFVSLLPDSAREFNDKLYQAIDMYFKVHPQLSEEEQMKICCSLNYEKLSAEALEHLSQTSKFPSNSKSKHSSIRNAKSIDY